MVSRAQRNEYKRYVADLSGLLDPSRFKDWEVIFLAAMTVCPDADCNELADLWKYGLQKCKMTIIDSIGYNTVVELWVEIFKTENKI